MPAGRWWGVWEGLDLTELFQRLEHWRQMAVLRSDPVEFRRVVCQAVTILKTSRISAVDICDIFIVRPREVESMTMVKTPIEIDQEASAAMARIAKDYGYTLAELRKL